MGTLRIRVILSLYTAVPTQAAGISSSACCSGFTNSHACGDLGVCHHISLKWKFNPATNSPALSAVGADGSQKGGVDVLLPCS